MLAGREREVEEAVRLLAAGRAVAITGEAGIGKTAVLRAIAEASGREVFSGAGLPSLVWSSYLALQRALRRPLPAGDRGAAAQEVARRVGRGLLLLDDLQWADGETLGLLSLLGGRTALLLGTRSHDPGCGGALEAIAACDAVEIALGSLDTEAAVGLARRVNPLLDAASAARVAAVCGGNPLLVEEVARGGPEGLPARRAVAARLSHCSPEALRCAAMLGLLGRRAGGPMVERAATELTALGLADLEEGRLGLRHQLVGEAAVSALGPAQRRALHAALARALDDPGEAARHHAAAGELREAAVLAQEAARLATEPAERARHLGLTAACTDGEMAAAFLLQAAAAWLRSGDHGAAAGAAEGAAVSGPAQATRWLLLAQARLAQGDGDGTLAAADQGLAVAGAEAPVRVGLLVETARALAAGGDVAGALSAATDAWVEAQATGAHRAAATLALGSAQHAAGSLLWSRTLAEAVELAEAEGDASLACASAHALAAALLVDGDPADARARARAGAALADRASLADWAAHLRGLALWVDLHADAACAHVAAACRALLDAPLPATAEDQVRSLLGLALADLGDHSGAGRVLEAQPRSAVAPLLHWTRAETAWLRGDAAEALRLASALLDAGPVPRPLDVLAVLTASWAAVETGVTALPAPPRPAAGWPGALDESAALHSLGRAPLVAQRGFDAAAQAWRGRDRRSELRCGWAAGEAALRAGDPGAAAERLRAVDAELSSAGLAGLRPRVHRSLRGAGQHPAGARAEGGSGLSVREREVLRLVADGLTSEQIARQLGIARSTVETHVRSAMVKLGAATRLEAAAGVAPPP